MSPFFREFYDLV